MVKSKQILKMTYGQSTSKEAMKIPIEVGQEKEEEDTKQDIVEGGTKIK